MNSEELKTEFGLEFPTEIDGYKRPDEPLDSGHDWFMEIPQLIAKDKVLYTGMNLILSALLSNEKLLKQWHDTLQNVVSAQDWRVVTDSLKGYMTPELKKKLDGIATGANNYVHPANHPATMITQEATHRFVTDTEKTTWNGKASTAVVSTTANGLMPKRDGSATSIFTGDGVWKSLAWNLITGKPSTFAPSAHNHDGSYLKLSGGSLTGALNLANDTLNLAGDDCYFGDQDIAGGFCLKGANGTTNLTFINKDNATQMASLSYAGGNLISSAKIQANLAGTADKATNDSSNRNIVNTYATKVSPAFSGTPTVPTPAEQDNSEQITNTEWVQTWVKAFVAELSNNIEVETQEDGHFSCPALGITGLMAQNGYICLGKLFGGLILQWGTNSSNSINTRVAYNIPFTTFEIPVSIANDDGTQIYRYSIGKHDINGFNQIVASDVLINTFNRVWFSIGK